MRQHPGHREGRGAGIQHDRGTRRDQADRETSDPLLALGREQGTLIDRSISGRDRQCTAVDAHHLSGVGELSKVAPDRVLRYPEVEGDIFRDDPAVSAQDLSQMVLALCAEHPVTSNLVHS